MTHEPAAHLSPEEVELWAEGLLPAARAIHLAQCPSCLAAGETERRLSLDLARLPRLAPGADFVERVMQQVRIPARSGEHRS